MYFIAIKSYQYAKNIIIIIIITLNNSFHSSVHDTMLLVNIYIYIIAVKHTFIGLTQ